MRYLYDRIVDDEGRRAFALVRLFRTELVREPGRRTAADGGVASMIRLTAAEATKCLTLVARSETSSAGIEPPIAGHQAIPLPNVEAVEQTADDVPADTGAWAHRGSGILGSTARVDSSDGQRMYSTSRSRRFTLHTGSERIRYPPSHPFGGRVRGRAAERTAVRGDLFFQGCRSTRETAVLFSASVAECEAGAAHLRGR